MRRKGARRTGDAAQAPRYNALALKALHTLDLDANATETSIKARYKDLVKTPPPRRQRRRPFVGGETARDHQGL